MSFKAGDRVKITSTDWAGLTGVILGPNTGTYTSYWPYRVKLDEGQANSGEAPMSEKEFELIEPASKPGVWVVIAGEYNDSIESVHATEIDALRAANAQGYGKVAFREFG